MTPFVVLTKGEHTHGTNKTERTLLVGAAEEQQAVDGNLHRVEAWPVV